MAGRKNSDGLRHIAVKCRIYPNKEQKEQLAKTFGCVRFLYNRMLSDKKQHYEETGKQLKNTPAQYKPDHPWLKEVDSLALANAQLHLEQAYKNFFARPETGFPKYKCKHDRTASYTTNRVNGNIRIEGNKLRLPKVGAVRIREHRKPKAGWSLKSVTISLESTGKYYASILYSYLTDENQVVDDYTNRTEYKVLGIDFAMHGLAVFSDGTRADYPMYYRTAEKKLAREQRKLSHCKTGSRNYQKQKIKLARAHEKIRNQRNDFQHKLSYRIAESMDVIVVEDLNMKGMSRSLHFGKSTMDNANGMFREKLERKMQERGKTFVKVDRYFPSSKRCSCCGKIKEDLKLSDRIYKCSCGNCMDRDINAAINLREEGKRILHIA